MNFLYITNARFPTRKAYGVNITKTCEALAEKGAEVVLVAPLYRRDRGRDGISCFSEKKKFATRAIRPWIDGVTLGWSGYWINRIIFSFCALFIVSRHACGKKIILTRDELSGWLLRLFGYPVFFDLHGFPARKSWLWVRMMRAMTGLIVTSPAKVARCRDLLGVPVEKITVAPNGFDPALFNFQEDKIILRQRLGLPQTSPTVVYTGHLYDWKGAYVLADTAKLLPWATFVFVGGMPWDIEHFRKKYGNERNIVIKGYEPHAKIPLYLKAADVLVLPNSRVSNDRIFAAHSESDTSPIKMFEYMASGTPIVASDLPSIREVLNEKNAILVNSDDTRALAQGIRTAFDNIVFSRALSQKAFDDAKNYTWAKRAEVIMNHASLSHPSAKLKIGIILHPYGEKQPGGLPRMILEWTKAMLRVGPHNEYIIYFKERPKTSPDLPGRNWRYEVLGKGIFWLERLRFKTKADVYIFNTPVLPFLYTPKKTLVIALDFPYKYLKPDNAREYLWRFFLGMYHRRSLHRADAVVAISNAAKKDVVALFSVPEKKIVHIPQGYINICAVPQMVVPSLPKPFFLFVSAIKERKNVLRIVQAFHHFKLKNPRTGHFLVLVGRYGGTYYDQIVEYIKDNELADKILFLGHRNDGELSYIYRRAEAVIFPSIIEATGNPVIESMYCGTPVITSNICGPAELGSDGSALLVDPYNIYEIKEAMEKIVFDKKVREELVEKGYEQVKKFQWDDAGKNLLRTVSIVAMR